MKLGLKRERGEEREAEESVCACVCVKRGKLEAGGWQTKVREGREE